MLSSKLSWSYVLSTISRQIMHLISFQTPLGAISVVVSAMLSSLILKEKLTFFGWLGCGLCIVRPAHSPYLSTALPVFPLSVPDWIHGHCPQWFVYSFPSSASLHHLHATGPQEASVGQITEFEKLFIAPGFLVYISVLFAISFSIMFYFGPK